MIVRMKDKRIIVFLLFAAVLCGCQNALEVGLTVRECAPIPTGRASACACVADGKAYVFGGRNSQGAHLNDLWQYDPKTDTWTDLGAAPMKGRVNATMVSDGTKLFVGLGYSASRAYVDSAYMRDWWEYTPATGTWKQLANYPSSNTVAATSLIAEGNIYVLFGFGHHYSQDIYTYSTSEDRWTSMGTNTQRPPYHFGGRGTMHQGRLYFGLGYSTSGNIRRWYEADVPADSWAERKPIPGKGRVFAACAGSGEYIYIFGGRHFAGDITRGEIMDTYARYSPTQDKWEWCGRMPGGRAENLVAFTIDGTVYFGLGENEEGKIQNALYRIEE